MCEFQILEALPNICTFAAPVDQIDVVNVAAAPAVAVLVYLNHPFRFIYF